MKYMLTLLLFLLLPCYAFSFANYCSKPSEPRCIVSSFNLQDKYAVTRCENKIQEYDKNLQSYNHCIETNLEKERIQLVNKAQCKLQCKVKKEDFCSCS